MEVRNPDILVRFRHDQLRRFMPKPKVHLRQPSHPLSNKIYPGCYQLPYLIEQMYHEMEKEYPVVCSYVSESAFAYYCAVVVYNRILHLRNANHSDTLTEDEKRFMKQIKALNLRIPLLLQCYIAGMGNVAVHNGHSREKFVFRAHPIKYVSSADRSMGWFGRVGPTTHFLYQKYPCLTVFARRIVEEIKYEKGENPQWNLPEDIAPEEANAGFPSENMLGYAPRQTLMASQKIFLKRCGVSESSFPTSNDSFCLSLTLLKEIGKELIREKTFDLYSSRIQRHDGSLAQLPYHSLSKLPENEKTTPEDDEIPRIEVDGPFRQYSKYRLPNALHVAGLRFQYQMKCTLNEQCNMWCIYDFNRFKEVPEAWCETMTKESNDKIDTVSNYHTKDDDWADLTNFVFDLNGKTFWKLR